MGHLTQRVLRLIGEHMAYTIWRYDPDTDTTTQEFYATYFGAQVRLVGLLNRCIPAYLEIQEGN